MTDSERVAFIVADIKQRDLIRNACIKSGGEHPYCWGEGKGPCEYHDDKEAKNAKLS